MKNNLIIYTDGSHLKHTSGRLGIGAVLINKDTNKKIDEFSEEVSIDFLKKNFNTTEVSNPTCEMLATLFALRKFHKEIKNCDSLVMKADYLGCQAFNTGIWTARAPYIQKIKEETSKIIKTLGLEKKIQFEWVKGHQKKSIQTEDAKWNNYVDSLARGEKN